MANYFNKETGIPFAHGFVMQNPEPLDLRFLIENGDILGGMITSGNTNESLAAIYDGFGPVYVQADGKTGFSHGETAEETIKYKKGWYYLSWPNWYDWVDDKSGKTTPNAKWVYMYDAPDVDDKIKDLGVIYKAKGDTTKTKLINEIAKLSKKERIKHAGEVWNLTEDFTVDPGADYKDAFDVNSRTFKKGDQVLITAEGILDKLHGIVDYKEFADSELQAGSGLGLVKKPTASDDGKFLKSDGSWGTPDNTTYKVFTDSSLTAGSGLGLVKKPSNGDTEKFLKGDGTWAETSSASNLIDQNFSDNYLGRIDVLKLSKSDFDAKKATHQLIIDKFSNETDTKAASPDWKNGILQYRDVDDSWDDEWVLGNNSNGSVSNYKGHRNRHHILSWPGFPTYDGFHANRPGSVEWNMRCQLRSFYYWGGTGEYEPGKTYPYNNIQHEFVELEKVKDENGKDTNKILIDKTTGLPKGVTKLENCYVRANEEKVDVIYLFGNKRIVKANGDEDGKGMDLRVYDDSYYQLKGTPVEFHVYETETVEINGVRTTRFKLDGSGNRIEKFKYWADSLTGIGVYKTSDNKWHTVKACKYDNSSLIQNGNTSYIDSENHKFWYETIEGNFVYSELSGYEGNSGVYKCSSSFLIEKDTYHPIYGKYDDRGTFDKTKGQWSGQSTSTIAANKIFEYGGVTAYTAAFGDQKSDLGSPFTSSAQERLDNWSTVTNGFIFYPPMTEADKKEYKNELTVDEKDNWIIPKVYDKYYNSGFCIDNTGIYRSDGGAIVPVEAVKTFYSDTISSSNSISLNVNKFLFSINTFINKFYIYFNGRSAEVTIKNLYTLENSNNYFINKNFFSKDKIDIRKPKNATVEINWNDDEYNNGNPIILRVLICPNYWVTDSLVSTYNNGTLSVYACVNPTWSSNTEGEKITGTVNIPYGTRYITNYPDITDKVAGPYKEKEINGTSDTKFWVVPQLKSCTSPTDDIRDYISGTERIKWSDPIVSGNTKTETLEIRVIKNGSNGVEPFGTKAADNKSRYITGYDDSGNPIYKYLTIYPKMVIDPNFKGTFKKYKITKKTVTTTGENGKTTVSYTSEFIKGYDYNTKQGINTDTDTLVITNDDDVARLDFFTGIYFPNLGFIIESKILDDTFILEAWNNEDNTKDRYEVRGKKINGN